MSKTRIIDLLGEKALLRPELLNQAIVANERAKYLLGMLQMAASHAESPDGQAATLRSEREACGIADTWLDNVTAHSEELGPWVYHIPDAKRVVAMLSRARARRDAGAAVPWLTTLRPLTNASPKRKTRLFNAIPPIEGNVLQRETIAALTSGRPAAGDGVHLLVMDVHKELNQLQAQIADEDIDGARPLWPACTSIPASDRRPRRRWCTQRGLVGELAT